MSSVALPAPARILPNGMDFADWLSPILVKELRQGLKTKMFITTFILIQVVMILVTGLQLLEVANGGTGNSSVLSGFFGAFIWIPLVILMPARGLTAVSEEVKVNTLDLVQLTRLTAFRIVLGKWVALVAQTLLVVTAILPYAVLRYFFGEVDIVSDLGAIGSLILSSMVLTAGAIALSSVHIVVRILVILGFFFLSTILMNVLFWGVPMSARTGGANWLLWMSPVLTGLHVYLLLEIAASRIAPVSENHAGRKRVVVLCMGLVAVLLAWTTVEEFAVVSWCISTALATAWIVLEALSERTTYVPSLYAGLARWGFLGRLAGRVLYPGWASGLVFTFLVACCVMAIGAGMTHRSATDDLQEYLLESALMAPIIFTSIVCPLLVILLFPRARQPVWLYVLTQALFGLCFVVANVASNAPNLDEEDVFRWLAPLPTSVLFVLMDEGADSTLGHFYAMFTLPVCALILAYLGFRAVREFRTISQLEDRSQASSEEEKVELTAASKAA